MEDEGRHVLQEIVWAPGYGCVDGRCGAKSE